MPKKASPRLEPRVLRSKLAAVRRRLRFVVTVRGISWLLTVLLATAAVAGLLDWLLHLPGLLRALILVSALAGAGWVLWRYLLRPLAAKADDLTIALQVEERYPNLNDALASTVQFLDQKTADTHASPVLRREAVKRALGKAGNCDFNQVVDRRGVRAAWLAMAGAGLVAVSLVLLSPRLASTALARLLVPFGDFDWPRQTQLDIEPPPERIGRNEVFLLRASVRGVIPEKAVVVYKLDGSSQAEHDVELAAGDDGQAQLLDRLEPGRAQRSFSFRVWANDAVSKEYLVKVLPPPQLALLNGRPSPRINLRFPAYTDLLPLDLPDGSSNVEAVAGTLVTLRAAADRPLRRAWVEYQPELGHVELLAAVAPLGAAHEPGALLALLAAQSAFEKAPAELSAGRTELTVRFRPILTGTYVLHFEDDSGLGNTRLLQVYVQADPAPVVALERPSPTRDTLDLLPGASFPLQAVVSDPTFAVRSVWLEYRLKKADPPRALPLYDHRAGLLSGMDHARLQRVIIDRTVSLKQFKHLDPAGADLKEGDVLTFQVCADDFDDVSVDKQPGRSHEVEIRVVGRNALDLILNQDQAKVQQDLVRLREEQREAQKKVAEVQAQFRQQARLRPEDSEKLLQAEQAQQQIRQRVGDQKEGLRADVARILESLRNNDLPRSVVHDRMERVQAELERLAREELPQIEPRLTDARKEADKPDGAGPDKERRARLEQEAKEKEKQAQAKAGEAQAKADEAARLEKDAAAQPDKSPKRLELEEKAKEARKQAEQLRQQAQQLRKEADARRQGDDKQAAAKDALAEARRHQEEVEKTLNDLLARLEPFASTAEIKGEAKAILQEQKRLAEEVERKQEERGFIGKELEELSKPQKAELERLKEDQHRLEERLNQLMGKMRQVQQERAKDNRDSDTAKELEEALDFARQKGLVSQMERAREQIERNALVKAGETQRENLKDLENFVKKLEDRRAAELDRLAKKLREEQKRLEELTDEMERLQKKAEEAAKIADPKQREEELKKLAKRQAELKKQAEEVAERLSRLGQRRAGQALAGAAEQMELSRKQMEQGENPGEQQEEALDRLDEAQREVERARQEAEEELAREQMAKLAEIIKGYRDRQERLVAEADDVQREVLQRKGWSRGMLSALSKLGERQTELADEMAAKAKERLAGAQVFGRTMQKAADAMKRAADRIAERRDAAVKAPEDVSMDAEAVRSQKEALRRLDQLLDALKPESGMAARQPGGNNDGGQGDGGAMRGGDGDGLPPLAQLKLLRAMQAEINQRLEAFTKQHPDGAKLNEKDQAELQGIRKDQQEIADLLEELTRPAEPEGGQQ